MRVLTTLLILFLALSVSLSKVSVIYVEAQAIDDARSKIHEAYRALVEAYDAGGDISEPTDKLNEALSLTAKAEEIVNTDPNEAERLASQAQTLAQSVVDAARLIKEQGLRQGQTTTIILVTSTSVLAIAGILIYIRGPEALWKMWLKLRKNYRVAVRRSSNQNKGVIITADEACALVLAVIIIIAAFAASQVLFARRVAEPFSELGILGPQMKIGDYPKEIVAGETVKLYAYVGNQMGRPIYYVVMVKLGDNTTSVNPAPITPRLRFEKILLHNGTWTFPVGLTLTQTGQNQRIIFELWFFNETSNQNQYHERWGQVWINVTAPPI